MNLETTLASLENAQTQLASSGFSLKTLLAVGAVALLLFFLSLRQVMIWFLNIHRLHGEIRQLRAEIQAVQTSVNALGNRLNSESPRLTPEASEEKPSRFRLDH